jgi:RecA/RadA recombinase
MAFCQCNTKKGTRMNANELADLLEVDNWYKLVTREEIATMLRQQQAEIESLRLQLSTVLTNQNLRTYDGRLK